MDSTTEASSRTDQSAPAVTVELDETAALFYDFSPGAAASSQPSCPPPTSCSNPTPPSNLSTDHEPEAPASHVDEQPSDVVPVTDSSPPAPDNAVALPETSGASESLELSRDSEGLSEEGATSSALAIVTPRASLAESPTVPSEAGAIEDDKPITTPNSASDSQEDTKPRPSKKKGKDKTSSGKKTAAASKTSTKGGSLKASSDGQLLIGFSIQQQQQAKNLQEDMESLVADASTSEETKVAKLHQALIQQASWLKDLSKDVVVLQHKLVQLQQEKEAAIAEAGKVALVKGKLEVLCRELQSQNKAVLAESKQIAQAEQQKREQLSDHFLNSIKDVEMRLGEQGETQMKALEENKKLVEALHRANQQLQMHEKEKEYEAKKVAVEMRIAELKLKQQEEVTAKERAQRDALLLQFKQQQKEQATLQKQMSEYGSRFQECQEMLAKSNEVMSTFKDERNKMVSRMQKTEKELLELRAKSNKSDAALIQMLEERNALKKQLASTKTQKEKLESLCRTLQEERKKRLVAAAPQEPEIVGSKADEGTPTSEVSQEGTAA